MPGYDVTPVEPLKSGLQCLECKLVLCDPVQTDEGDRLCRTCYDKIKRTGVSEGGIELGEEETCYPDRAVGKEIKLLPVKCNNHTSGCPWQGKLQDLEDHECKYRPQLCCNEGCGKLIPKSDIRNHEKNKCTFRVVACKYCKQKTIFNQLEDHNRECSEYPVECDRCSGLVKRNLMDTHKETHCPYMECLCGEQLLRKNMEAHYSEPGALFTHMRSMLTAHRAVLNAQKHLQSTVEEKEALSKREMTHPGELLRVENEIKTSQTKFDGRVALLEQKISALEPLKYEVETARTACAKVQETSRSLKEKVDQQEEKILHVQGQVTVTKGRPGSGAARHTENYSDSRMTMVEKKLEEFERQNTMLKVHVSELELQLQASLASTHNGSFLWRIPDVVRRRRDAVEERITSIYSPPFYTGRNGYKMCIRAYLNGDGIGYKTHLSLFFVLMRGEYDPLLKWPFEHKVSLILVDQDHRKHIVQTFKPTPESSSFKRPTSDMNVASGCPQFSKVNVLDEKNYVKDDIMFIKCIVDVTRIFHP